MKFSYHIALIIFCIPLSLFSQVTVRDTVVRWQHHAFELNDDYSMLWHTTDDNEIEEVLFDGKVLENELIRLVVLPDYGARIISFVYRPTGYEHLYQSECGSAYGINDGNFYYDWLMVYGGIFPTFPEPEHGKTWLMPWNYSVIKNTADTITIRMELTDSTSFGGTPGGFNNGITHITCQVDVSVYQNSSLWDFDVRLINNKSYDVNYEYWTCTTLTPGSETGNTGSPLNSEMIIPLEQYEAAWSPGGWIGNWGQLYAFDQINYLSEWDNMGIAYAHELNSSYWGVINHDNSEGIFRISENLETPGMKFWTWGKNNVGNDLFDFSNGGADNYIELWAGNSLAFFEDAYLGANQQLAWKESYVATSGMGGITEINQEIAVFTSTPNPNQLRLEINKFTISDEFHVNLTIAEESLVVFDKSYNPDELQVFENIDLAAFGLANGSYTAAISITGNQGEMLLFTEFTLEIATTSISENNIFDFKVQTRGNKQILLNLSDVEHFDVYLTDIMGRIIDRKNGHRSSVQLSARVDGIYIVTVVTANNTFSKKILVN
jgi:hypothetical protein